MKRILLSLATLLIIALAAIASSEQTKTKFAAANGEQPQPLYTNYRGVTLGMTPQEVRAKLGEPVLKDAELDYFVFSDNLTAQIAYDAAHKVKAISVDFSGGLNAPDYRTVVGTELDSRPDGSAFKMIRYEAQGFWVSYNRTAGPVVIVTITIQKI